MKNQKKTLKEPQTEFFTWQNSLDTEEYIIYRLTPENKLLTRLHKSISKNIKKDTQYLKYYSQLKGGRFFKYKTNLLQTQQILISNLQNNIIQFGSPCFNGFGPNLISIYIRLKLTHIQHITFRNLKSLNFYGCLLDSIEPLSWLDIKQVKQLNFGYNCIGSLKSLAKTSFIYLRQLNLENNYISTASINCLTRLHSPQIISVSFKQQRTSLITITQQDLVNLIKMEIDPQKSEPKLRFLTIICSSTFNSVTKTPWMVKVNKNYFIQFNQINSFW